MATESTPADGGGARQRLGLWLHEDPPTLDPQGGVDEWSWRLHILCYEGLTRRGADGVVSPGAGLAESWEVSDDGLRWTFTLRDGARWSDGRPLEAEHVRHAFARSLDPRTGRRSAWQMYLLAGGRDCHRLAGAPDAEIDAALDRLGVEILDPRRVRLTLASPAPYVPDLLALPPWMPLRPDAPPPGDAARVPAGVYSGPFLLRSYEPGRLLHLTRNPYYWDARRVALEAVDLHIGGDPLALYREGVVDVVALDEPDAASLPPAEVVTADEAAVAYMVCNTQDPLLTDHGARLAIAGALDRGAIARAGGGTSRPAVGLVPWAIGRGAFREAAGPVTPRVPDSARLPGGTTLSLLCADTPGNTAEARELAAQVEDRLGAGVQVEVTGLGERYYRIREGAFQLALVAWKADYDDPLGFLNEHVSDGAAGNQSKWSDPDYDGLLARARAAADPGERQRLLVEAERMLIDFAAVQPLLYRGRHWAVRKGVRGLVHAPVGPSPEVRWAARGVEATVA